MSWDIPQSLDDLKRDFLNKFSQELSPQLLLQTDEAKRLWLTAQLDNELLRLLYFATLKPGPSLFVNEGAKTLDTVQDIRDSASPTFQGLRLDSLSGYLKAVDGFVGVDTGAGVEETSFTYSFAFGDPTPQIIAALDSPCIVTRVTLIVKTAFNGTLPSVTVGDSLVNARLMAAVENDLTAPGIFETNPGVFYTVPTNVNIYLVPGAGASAGTATVIVYTI